MGNKVNSHLIKKIEDSDGNILYEYKNQDEYILNKSTTYILNELLSNCSNPKFVDYTSATCISIKDRITNKYAIKTGTTDADMWIIGYNKNAILGIWTGYDNNKKIDSSDGYTL